MERVNYVCKDCKCHCHLDQVHWLDAPPNFCVQGLPHSKWEVYDRPLNKVNPAVACDHEWEIIPNPNMVVPFERCVKCDERR